MSESIARDLETLEGVACRMPSSNAFVGVLVALADSNIQNQLGMPFDGNEGVAVSEVLVPFPARLGADEHPRGSPCSSGVEKSDLRRKGRKPHNTRRPSDLCRKWMAWDGTRQNNLMTVIIVRGAIDNHCR